MNARLLVPAVGVLLLCQSHLHSQDLRTIDRSLAREPAYTAKKPGYCLLVFGLKAETRVWLVRDDGALYVDRDGDGDLTTPRDKIAPAPPSATTYSVDGLGAGAGVPRARLQLNLLADNQFRLRLTDDEDFMQGVGHEPNAARPAWGDSPATAPVVHLNGPKTLALWNTPRSFSANPGNKRVRDQSLRLKIGTPGLGEGTFASFHCSCRDDNGELHGVVEFPREGGGVIKQSVQWGMLG